LSPVQNGLFLRSTYPDASNPEYTITLDFSDYPVGVSGISFTFSDVDIDASIIYSAQAIIANC
jgi:hypothetical protein